MRISGGKARGVPLRVNKKSGIRPSIETVRERLFSSIFNLVENATVLDLFAGSGAYGLEALSRGAKKSTMVEKNRKVFGDLKANLVEVAKSANLLNENASLINRDVVDLLKAAQETGYDLIFIDPPYSEIERLTPRIFELLKCNNYLSPGGLVILESPGEIKMHYAGWKIERVLGKEKRGSPVHRIYSLPTQPDQ